MIQNRGFITIMSLIIMAIILIFFLYLIYTFSLEYMITNSIINSIQSGYFSESKIYLVLNSEKYYNKIMPYVVKFVKDIYNTRLENIRINLNKEDLLDGDPYNLVSINIFHDYDGRIVLEISTESTYERITKQVISKITVIKDFFELGLPIVSSDTLDEKAIYEFQEYMRYLENNLSIQDLDEEMHGIHIKDYEKIKLKKDFDKTVIECYRNTNKKPIKVDPLMSDTIFLIYKGNVKGSELSIVDLTSDNCFRLSGIIYVDGDLIVQDDFEFNGILIIDGNFLIDSSSNMKVKGILLYDNYIENIKNENLQVEYDIKEIRKYGIYLPNFIDFNIRNIKSN